MNRKAFALVLSLSLPFAASIGMTATAFADTPPAAGARAEAPAAVIEGRFQRYLVSPQGRPEGLLLEGGTVVRLPPRAVREGAPELTAGDVVRVEGRAIKTPTGTVMARALVQRGRDVIADARAMGKGEHKKGEHKKGEHKGEHKKGEHKKGDKAPLASVTATGKIVAIMSTPKGRVAGLVLDDGTTASTMHAKLDTLGLKVGDQVTLDGKGGIYAKGKGMRVEQVKLPSGEVKKLEHQGRRPHGVAI